MKNQSHRTWLLFFVPLAVISAGLILGISVLSSNASRSRRQERTQEQVAGALRSGQINVEGLSVRNRTRLFRVLALELAQDREGVLLRMTNDYDKRITAFQLSYGIIILKKELIYNETDWIQPHQIYTFENEAEPELDTKGIGILAVIFEDGTADGDRQAIKELRQYRAGMKTAINDFLPKLKSTLGNKKESLLSAIRDLRSEISLRPEISDASLSYHTRLGIHDQRWRIVEELSMVSEDGRAGHDSLSLQRKQELQYTGLARLVDIYDRILARL